MPEHTYLQWPVFSRSVVAGFQRSLTNQLPPSLTSWVRENLGADCICVRDLALQRASDLDIFNAARAAGALVMTKDADFADLVNQLGAPPQIVLVTCGNTSNSHLRQILAHAWPTVSMMLDRGEPLVEVGDRPR